MKIIYIFIAAAISLYSCSTKKENSAENTSQSETSNNSENTEKSQITTDDIHNNASADNGTKQVSIENQPVISFETLTKDFGTITDGEQIELVYNFKNSGGSDLIITQVQPGCGCTVADYPKDPIKPGKGGKIRAKFNSEGKQGDNTKNISVFSNATEPNVLLQFTGKVLPKKN